MVSDFFVTNGITLVSMFFVEIVLAIYFTKTKTNFESLFNSKLTSDLLELKLSLANISTILNSLSEFSSNEIPYTSQVKNTYFQILNEYNILSKTL